MKVATAGEKTANRPVQALAARMESQIRTGPYVTGDRYLSVRQVARRYQASPVTVLNAMQQLARDGLLEIRERSGTYIGRSVTPSSGTRNRQIVHLLSRRDNTTHEHFIRAGLQEGLLEVLPDVSIQLNWMREDQDAGNYLARLFDADSSKNLAEVLGIVLFRLPAHVHSFFVRRHLPAVVFGHTDDDEIELPRVGRSQRRVGQLAAGHLLELGHRRIGLLMSTSWTTGDNTLLEGIERELGDACSLTVRCIEDHHDGENSVICRMLEWSDRPTALICRRRPMVSQCFEATARLRLRVPRDLSIIDVSGSAALNQHQPTRVSLDIRDAGCRVGELIKQMAAGRVDGRTIVELPSELIVGQSTGPAPDTKQPRSERRSGL